MAEDSIRPCYQSTFAKRICGACGRIAGPVHMPTVQVGYFCAKCCPACKVKPAEKGKVT